MDENVYRTMTENYLIGMGLVFLKVPETDKMQLVAFISRIVPHSTRYFYVKNSVKYGE